MAKTRWFVALVALATGFGAGCHRAADAPATAARAESTPEAKIVAFRNVRLIDGTNAAPIENATLVIEAGHVRAAGPEVDIPAGARIVEGAGLSIVPGLVSDHSHVGLVDGVQVGAKNGTRANVLRQLRQYEAYGVTTVTSLGMNGAVPGELEPALHRAEIPGADLFGADRGIGIPEGAPPVDVGSDQLARAGSPAEAIAAVRDAATRHPDLIKVWVDDFHGTLHHKMAPEVYRAVIDEAHRLGLRVAAHVYYADDALALAKAGVDILAHGIRDRVASEELVRVLREHHTWYVPTLGLDEAFYVYAEAPAWTHESFFRHALQPALVAQLDDPSWRKKIRDDASKVATDKGSLQVNQANLQKLFAGGVAIGFGTDSGATPLRIPGFAEHRELALMVQAGLTPLEALRIATGQAARLLRLADRGELTAGKLADFVVVGGDPSTNIDDLDHIVEVWHRGVRVAKTVESFTP